jgi:hypothetical protein
MPNSLNEVRGNFADPTTPATIGVPQSELLRFHDRRLS